MVHYYISVSDFVDIFEELKESSMTFRTAYMPFELVEVCKSKGKRERER